MNNIFKLSINLFSICAVAALLLGFTNKVTLPIIEERNIQANNEARQLVLPKANQFQLVSSNEYDNIDGIISEVYEGKNGSDIIGYTIKTLPKGYGGEIELIVGISSEGKIEGINIGNMSETPGLGAKANESDFKDQFNGKNASKITVSFRSLFLKYPCIIVSSYKSVIKVKLCFAISGLRSCKICGSATVFFGNIFIIYYKK